jgi:hypothetical protein
VAFLYKHGSAKFLNQIGIGFYLTFAGHTLFGQIRARAYLCRNLQVGGKIRRGIWSGDVGFIGWLGLSERLDD